MLLALNKMLLNLFVLHKRRIPVKGVFSSSEIFLFRFKYIFFNLKEMYGIECKNHNRFLQWHLKTENKNDLKPKKADSVLLKGNT